MRVQGTTFEIKVTFEVILEVIFDITFEVTFEVFQRFFLRFFLRFSLLLFFRLFLDICLAQWKLQSATENNSKQIEHTIIALKQQLLGVIFCFFMHLRWLWLLRLFAQMRQIRSTHSRIRHHFFSNLYGRTPRGPRGVKKITKKFYK